MKNVFLALVWMISIRLCAQTNQSSMENEMINNVLISQYKAAFNMLRQVVGKTPDDQWNSDEYQNPNWQIAYHAIWSAKLYLGANMESFIPWDGAVKGGESLGGANDWENPDDGITLTGHHTRSEVLSFIAILEKELSVTVSSLPLSEDSGFEWYPYSRLELHINNIRHLQHHTAQLIERMKAKGISGFPWAIDGNPEGEW